jgi:hypothetical protein
MPHIHPLAVALAGLAAGGAVIYQVLFNRQETPIEQLAHYFMDDKDEFYFTNNYQDYGFEQDEDADDESDSSVYHNESESKTTGNKDTSLQGEIETVKLNNTSITAAVKESTDKNE